jgi:hypothetical protein
MRWPCGETAPPRARISVTLVKPRPEAPVATVKTSVEFWLENSVHADGRSGPYRGRADIREMAERLVRFAEGQGYTKQQIESEIGDICGYIRAGIDRLNAGDTARLKK